jgi:hypothetical protein
MDDYTIYPKGPLAVAWWQSGQAGKLGRHIPRARASPWCHDGWSARRSITLSLSLHTPRWCVRRLRSTTGCSWSQRAHAAPWPAVHAPASMRRACERRAPENFLKPLIEMCLVRRSRLAPRRDPPHCDEITASSWASSPQHLGHFSFYCEGAHSGARQRAPQWRPCSRLASGLSRRSSPKAAVAWGRMRNHRSERAVARASSDLRWHRPSHICHQQASQRASMGWSRRRSRLSGQRVSPCMPLACTSSSSTRSTTTFRQRTSTVMTSFAARWTPQRAGCPSSFWPRSTDCAA